MRFGRLLLWFCIPFLVVATLVNIFNAFVLDTSTRHFGTWGEALRHWIGEIGPITLVAVCGVGVVFALLALTRSRGLLDARLPGMGLAMALIPIAVAEVFVLLHRGSSGHSPYADWIAISYVFGPAATALVVLSAARVRRREVLS